MRDRILAEVKPVDILSYYGITEKKGRYLCPFHSDSNPSMTVKGDLIRCWSCMGKSMNVIDFVMQYEGINFLDAIKRLATIGNVAGVEIEVNNEYRYRKMLREIDLDLIQLNDFLKSGLVDRDMVLLDIQAKENEKKAIVNMMERSGKYWD